MKLEAESGVWISGPDVDDVPAVAVLEVSGALLEWTVDDPLGAAATRMTVTDVALADWLWRVVGPAGHAALVAALDGDSEDRTVEVAQFDLQSEALEPLRRLAVGHWLRRWWPASSRDGIVPLDRALLDGELAVLTNAAQEFFTEDTFDSDVEGLLAPHRAALQEWQDEGDPRVVAMVDACRELAEDLGSWGTESSVALADSRSARRDDYALAAGPDRGRGSPSIARGVGSVDWVSVPSATFDAADDTVEWSIEAADAALSASVRVALAGDASASGVSVELRSGSIRGSGVLDADGTVALTLVDADGGELTENRAWDHDWSATTVAVGPARPGSATAAAVRQRLRDYARARLARPGPDAFLTEIVAAESDY
jgi:hypothetical protein